MNPPAQLEKPATASPEPQDATIIHVIPEQFHGATMQKKVVPPAVTPPPSSAVAPPTIVPPPTLPKKPLSSGPVQKKPIRLYMIVGVVAFVAAVAGYYFFVFRKTPAQPPVVNSAPSAPVCGDNKCDAPTETQQSCPVDCKPLPICGDTLCDTSETPISCPADCTAPVCGDNTCDVTTETFTSCPVDCPKPPPKPGKDMDSDGLTDIEERSIYQTDPANPDSDNDSFVDLNEVLNQFDPAKFAPADLVANPGISSYTTVTKELTVLFPRAWTTRETKDATGSSVFFNAPTSEFVQILEQQKQTGQTLAVWYTAQVPTATDKPIDLRKTKQGYPVIFTPDLMTAYIDVGNTVFVITYNLGVGIDLQYQATFQMMVHSLKFKSTVVAPPVTAPASASAPAPVVTPSP